MIPSQFGLSSILGFVVFITMGSGAGAQSSEPPQEAVVRQLVTRLLDSGTGNSSEGQEAARALAGCGTGGMAALEQIARQPQTPTARHHALEALVGLHRPEDRSLFLEVAADRGAPLPLRMLALDPLAADATALALLEPLLDDPEPRIQARVLRILGQVHFYAATTRARELLQPEAKCSLLLKIAAIEALRGDGGPESIRALVHAAAHTVGDVRTFALKSLSVMDQGAVLIVVLPMAAVNAPSDDALVAVELLDRTALPEVHTALRGLLDHADPQVQVAAIRALGTAGDQASRGRLEKLISGLDPLIAAAALDAVTRLRHDDRSWIEQLLRYAHSPRPELRAGAAEALAANHVAGAVPILVALLDDRDWPVREAAVRALGELRDRAAVAPLIEHLAIERARIREAIVKALRRTTGMAFRDYLRDWRLWWSDHSGDFQVPPLAEVEAMEARLARAATQGSTQAASFYGIAVSSDHLSLVVDVSGSMGEPMRRGSHGAPATGLRRGDDLPEDSTRIDVAKAEVARLLDALPEGAHLNLFFFSEDVQRWQRRLTPVTRTQAARALAFVRDRRAVGSTNLFDAITEALEDPQVDTIYVLSDGAPTSGKIVEPAALRAAIAAQNAGRRIQINTIALGRPSPLLQYLAEDSGGTYVER